MLDHFLQVFSGLSFVSLKMDSIHCFYDLCLLISISDVFKGLLVASLVFAGSHSLCLASSVLIFGCTLFTVFEHYL